MDHAFSKITLIGAGNLATHLSMALYAQGWCFAEIYSRDVKNAKALASKVKAQRAVSSLDFFKSEAELFVVAVPDDAIAHLSKTAVFPKDACIVHTSGSVPLSALEPSKLLKGVFYPLQTFSVDKKVDFFETPICLEAETPQLMQRLLKMANSISGQVYKIDSTSRKHLHLAAVFACNFTNHLLSLSNKVLDDQGLSLELLKPLVKETIHKAFEIGPINAQTGPAKRSDKDTIQEHLHLLRKKPELQKVYKILSEQIIKKAL